VFSATLNFRRFFVLAGLQGRLGHRIVQRVRGDDVHHVHSRVGQQVLVAGVAARLRVHRFAIVNFILVDVTQGGDLTGLPQLAVARLVGEGNGPQADDANTDLACHDAFLSALRRRTESIGRS
jgi:hypothetical protein